MIKYILSFFVLLLSNVGFSQITEDFSDGDFTNAPTWGGTTSKFIVNGSNQLQSNGNSSSADELYLSTPSSIIDSTVWQFYMHLDFNPTATTNFVKVYLVSDQSDLTQNLNGYYLRIGETGSTDTLELWRQDGASDTRILTGNSSFGSSFDATIRVERDELGNWDLFTDHSAGTNFSLEGTVFDNTYTTTSNFGVYCKYSTSSRFDQYFFDDISVNLNIGDTTSPTIDSVIVTGNNSLDVYFSEFVDIATAANSGNYSISNAQENANSAIIDNVDSSLVHLTFATDFINGSNDTLIISVVEDRSGNSVLATSISFFHLVEVPASNKDIVFNEVFPDPTPQVYLPSTEFVEIYNASNNIYNLENWQFVNTSTVKTMPPVLLYPDSFVILCSNSDTAMFQPFGNTIGFSSWTALSNGSDSLTLLDNNGTIIDVLEYESSWYNDPIKDDGGWSLELINPIDPCGTPALNWIASTDTVGGTPGTQNSVFDTLPDTDAPKLVEVTITASDEIRVMFNETMDHSSLLNGSYTISNGITVVGLDSVDNQSLDLTLSTNLDTGVFYTIIIDLVTDCPGNVIGASNSLDFVIGKLPAYGDIVINEIFADPSPAQYLPEVEFIELFNRTDKYIDLSGCRIDGTLIAEGAILADSFLIVCPIADTALFQSFGHVLGISSFPSLTNSGEYIDLTAADTSLIDSLTYSSDWYNDASKDDGGWSLERINPQTACSFSSNWTASNDTLGGTPGAANSVFDLTPDSDAPELVTVEILTAQTLRVYFNESMDSATLSTGIYALTNGLSVVGVDSVQNQSIDLILNTTIDTGTYYTVTINNVADCPGNMIGANNTFTFAIGKQPHVDDIIFTEIFADPSPVVGLPEAEYVEILNLSSNLLDLSNCLFDDAEIGDYLLQPNAYAIICKNADTSLYSPFGNVIGLASFPSLTNSGELITFHNQNEELLDAVDYELSWYQDAVKDNGGWSLERINTVSTCSFSANWIASNDANGGTPGTQNSVFDNSPDIISPEIAGLEVLSADSLLITYNEPMDSSSLAGATYNFTNGLTAQSIVTDVSPFDSVWVLLTNPIDTAINYSLTVTGVTDCPGNNLVNNNVSFVIGYLPQHGEIVINEIMADPTPAVVLPTKEFVEIYNTTSKLLDVTTLVFNAKEVEGNHFLEPNEYAILCDIDDTAEFNAFGKVIPLESFPAMTNSGDDLELRLTNNMLIDAITFSADWYNDNVKDDGGWTLEKRNPTAICNTGFNWGAANNFLGGTPGNENSIYDATPDQNTPELSSISVNSALSIILTFSEPMDSVSLVNGTFTISNGITVNTVTTQYPYLDAFVFFNNAVDTGITYTITVANVSDCPGNNIAANNSGDFIIGRLPQVGDVVINEIFADPSPQIGLPGQEFVEIFNTTTRLLDVSVLEFEGVDLPANSFLNAGEYVILCEEEDSMLFAPFGNVITLSTWPSLTNNGEGLLLINTKDSSLIDAVTYDIAWYDDEEKNDGGWTLEKKNPTAGCNSANNWGSSIHELGGTPGEQNSIYDLSADEIAPTFSRIEVVDVDTLKLFFNEILDPNVVTGGDYSITNGIGVSQAFLDNTNATIVWLILNDNLSAGVVYELTIWNITDCPGNLIEEVSVPFVLPELGIAGDIVLNEILFNPASGGSDFVEIVNTSDKYIDLSKWKISNYDEEIDSVDNVKVISETQWVLYPDSFALLSKDTGFVKASYPMVNENAFIEMSSFPTYSDDAGTAIVVSPDDEISDRFDYDEDMHFPLLVDEEGVSLERIDLSRTTNDYTNWHSAAETVGFATPGFQNSQYQPSEESEEVISLSPEIFSPDQDGYNDVLNISYKLDKPGYVGTLHVFDANGRLVRELMNNEFLSPEGVISWDGSNLLNEKARVGIYIIYFNAYHEQGDVKKVKVSTVLGAKL